MPNSPSFDLSRSTAAIVEAETSAYRCREAGNFQAAASFFRLAAALQRNARQPEAAVISRTLSAACQRRVAT